jgi:hypothetical protein
VRERERERERVVSLREENSEAKKVVNSRGPAVPTASMCVCVWVCAR